MGIFMASAAFRCTDKFRWQELRPQIEREFRGLNGLKDNFDTDGSGYAIVSPYGEMGMFLSELPAKITALTGDYGVFATCCDSDFALLELYHNGTLLEKSYVGECFEDYEELSGEYEKPNAALWEKLLQDASRLPELQEALGEVDVFAEDNLRLLTELTGLPIFDDDLVMDEFDS